MTTYHFYLTETRSGTTLVTTEWNGNTLAETGQDCERNLCRTLIRAGADDGPVEVHRGDTVCWTAPSPYRLAAAEVPA